MAPPGMPPSEPSATPAQRGTQGVAVQPQNTAIRITAEIAVCPIAAVKGRRRPVGAAPVAFHQVICHASKGIVVQLREGVIVLSEVGKDPPGGKSRGQRASRASKPACRRQPLAIRCARAMHPHLAIGSVVAKQRLEHRGPPGPVQHRRCRVGKAFGDPALQRSDHAAIAEHPPGERDRSGLGQGRQQRRQGAVTRVDVHEFIDIEKHHPIRLRLQRVTIRRFQRRPLRAFLPGAGIVHMGQPAQRVQPVEHRIRAVLAIIGKHQKVGEAHSPVLGEPFQKESALVLHRGDGQRAHQAASASSSSPTSASPS